MLQATAVSSSARFGAFADAADAVAATTSKLRKRAALAEYLRTLDDADLRVACTFLAAKPLPGADDRLGLGWVQVSAALTGLAGVDADLFGESYLRHSDIGDVAAELLQRRAPEPPPLVLGDVATAFEEIARAAGAEARATRLADLFRRADAREARYIAKVLQRDLRIGLREGLLEEAVAAAFEVPLGELRRAVMLVGEIGAAASLARAGKLAVARLELGRPLRFMLASPVEDADEVMRRVGEEAWVEDKYDGVRAQLHAAPGGATLFSRDLREVTRSFPEVVSAGAALDRRIVLDGELLAYREGAALAFKDLQHRLGRVAPDEALRERVPVVFVAFDLLHLDGRDLLDEPLRDRRAALESLDLPERSGERLLYTHLVQARSAEEVDRLFDDAQARRNEGLMIKDPESTYQPGRRGLGWLKLKRALATLDCVVVGVEWGHGKRRAVLSDYTFAVRDEANDRLVTIGKAYTGLTDAEIAEYTERFKQLTIRDFGRFRSVVPEVVVEIAFDLIHRSNRHKSGFALRFPRIVRIRDDKSPDEVDTLERVEALHDALAGGRVLLAEGVAGRTRGITEATIAADG
ncbi:MAG: ATP-dependent DNA ligase [Chloroflexota bacterium]|nr:ATP-dependent DNA ligase [Chloroflexota bacterium]